MKHKVFVRLEDFFLLKKKLEDYQRDDKIVHFEANIVLNQLYTLVELVTSLNSEVVRLPM